MADSGKHEDAVHQAAHTLHHLKDWGWIMLGIGIIYFPGEVSKQYLFIIWSVKQTIQATGTTYMYWYCMTIA